MKEIEEENKSKKFYDESLPNTSIIEIPKDTKTPLDIKIKEWLDISNIKYPNGVLKKELDTRKYAVEKYGLYFIICLYSNDNDIKTGVINIFNNNLHLFNDLNRNELFEDLFDYNLYYLSSNISDEICNTFINIIQNKIQSFNILDIDKTVYDNKIKELINLIITNGIEKDNNYREMIIKILIELCNNEEYSDFIFTNLCKEDNDEKHAHNQIDIINRIYEKNIKINEQNNQKILNFFDYCNKFTNEQIKTLINEKIKNNIS